MNINKGMNISWESAKYNNFHVFSSNDCKSMYDGNGDGTMLIHSITFQFKGSLV